MKFFKRLSVASRSSRNSKVIAAQAAPEVTPENRLLNQIYNKRPPYPPDEEARIQKLLSYKVLDTSAEDKFNEVADLASALCGAPVALVAMMDRERNWFKAKVGIPMSESPREMSFCGYTILNKDKLLVVKNALEDERFCRNELVLGPANARAYAGAPLVTPDGFAIGTLCVFDMVPREFNETQLRALKVLSHQVMAQLEIHKHVEEMQETIRKLQSLESSLRISKEIAEASSVSSFENLLLSQLGIQAFLAFLQEEFCPENLEFWMEVKKFRDQFPEFSAQQRSAAAKAIWEVFVKLGAAKQVNLNFDTVAEIEVQIKSEPVKVSLFDLARAEAFNNMKDHSYIRFLSSPQYADLMKSIRNIGFVRLQAETRWIQELATNMYQHRNPNPVVRS